ncbi:MAG: nickel-dependent hydrogenase large subunit [Ignisphaera sp.]
MGYNFIARVEGEGKVHIYIKDGKVSQVDIEISEAPRFFEYIVRGKKINYIPDIVSRICGLCGSSYVLVATKAFEKCLDIDVPEEIDELRKIIHLAERVKSHALHIFLLNLPDFLETHNTFEFRLANKDMFKDIMRFVTYSSNIMDLLGGRFHNVVNIKIGGIYKAFNEGEAAKILKFVEESIKLFKPLADFVLSLKPIPNDGLNRPHLLLSYENEYPHLSDEIVFSSLTDEERINIKDFEHIVHSEQKKGKNALLYRYKGSSYLVGPIARFNKAFSKLHGEVRDMLKSYDWLPPLRDVRQQIVARIAEMYDALLTMKEFFERYKKPDVTSVEKEFKLDVNKTTCVAAIEAPRGILYHRYAIDNQLKILECNIITPTAQNLASMEELSLEFLGKRFGDVVVNEAMARRFVEMIVRSFDPCISCSVHVYTLRY